MAAPNRSCPYCGHFSTPIKEDDVWVEVDGTPKLKITRARYWCQGCPEKFIFEYTRRQDEERDLRLPREREAYERMKKGLPA